MHDPLPYIVRLCCTVSDDSEPIISEHRTVAYDIFEAITQSMCEAMGSTIFDPKNVKVELVQPDLEAYFKRIKK